ncbi:MAG: T9SS type A sorting domain-containing protein [Prevotella sp.]|nr:T9SS type A sorting domain-containing protein [Prevotella sp.]
MRNRRLIIALAVALLLSAQVVRADEVEATFLVATLTSGQTESVMLTNDSTVAAPMLYHKQGQMLINGHLYDVSEIAGIRIEKRMVDAIRDVRSQVSSDTRIYDLQGRLVPISSDNLQPLSLPKGIYIVGGRKVVVK